MNNLPHKTNPSTYFTKGIGMFNQPKKHKNKSKKPKARNWLAVHAHFRSGSGSHKDRKKEANRKACRGRFKSDII
tara:strand:+ start:256 stop:480 length:225 start_codon:yes stop_codon:yes gene_type:complete